MVCFKGVKCISETYYRAIKAIERPWRNMWEVSEWKWGTKGLIRYKWLSRQHNYMARLYKSCVPKFFFLNFPQFFAKKQTVCLFAYVEVLLASLGLRCPAWSWPSTGKSHNQSHWLEKRPIYENY